jgi:rSAM/selenodomain-associated transferase 2
MEKPALSIIIPALNAADRLAACLGALEEARTVGLLQQVIVVDGGSRDATRTLADKAGAEVIETVPGRGVQLVAGGAAARGDWLLFLHADTRLEAGWAAEVARFLAAARHDEAATFQFALDADRRRARLLEYLVAFRVWLFGLAYGDQGLVISRLFYRELGGFRPLPLMEDVDLIRRIGRRRLGRLRARAVTSAVRYERSGYLKRSLGNLAILALYVLGVAPARLKRFYGP